MRVGIDYTAAVQQQAGIGRYTRELVSALLNLESEHLYTLFAATGGSTSPLPAPGPSLRLRTIPLSDEWVSRIWHRFRLPLPVEAIAGPQDIFYSPDFVLPPTLPRTRTLLTVHDLSFYHYPHHFVPPLVDYLKQVVPRSIRRAGRVLADSEATRQDLIRLLGVEPERVEVLYSGVSNRFRPEPEEGEWARLRSRYHLDDRPYILSVGTVQPRKNYRRLIRAFARLGSGLQLLIAGKPGWLCEEILAEARQYPHVNMLGLVQDEDLPPLYRQATLFAFPSLYEGFGLPVLEAMACGTPVLCSNRSSLPEVAGDAALLVDPESEKGLTAAMERMLVDDAMRKELVRRGIARAGLFTWERAARQLLAAMERTVE